MARFGSAGGGLARGLMAGQQLQLQKEQVRGARQKRLTDSLNAARDSAEDMFKQVTTAATEARAAGKTPEEMAGLRKLAEMSVAQTATLLEQARAGAAAKGLDPSTISPVSGAQYLEQKMRTFDALVGSAVSPEEQVDAEFERKAAVAEKLQQEFPNLSAEAAKRMAHEIEQPAAPTMLVRYGTPMAAELQKHGITLAPGQSARVTKNTDPVSGKVTYDTAAVTNDPKSTNITVEGTTIGKPLMKVYATELGDAFAAGRRAATNLARTDQLAALLSNPGFRTGTVQDALLPLQGLAESLGIDTAKTAEKLGLKLNDVADAQTFERLTREMIIESFESFKGNLNKEEVKLAFDAFQQLGKSKEANKRAIAAIRAASRLATLDYDEATEVTTDKQAGAWLRARNQRSTELYEQFYNEEMGNMSEMPDNVSDVATQMTDYQREQLQSMPGVEATGERRADGAIRVRAADGRLGWLMPGG